MRAMGGGSSDTPQDTAAWLRADPWILGGLVAWVVAWVVVELAWYRRTGRAFDVREAARSLAAGALVGGSASIVATLLSPVLALAWPYRFQTLSMDRAWHWALAWCVTDFAYYWIHRFLHATRLGWAFHATHHSTPQLSFLDSLRVSWGEQPVGVFAYGVPLVLLGVPPALAGFFYVFVSAYQLVVHTEMSWSLGPLGRFVYTPSAHRVHHSRKRAESDMNFGGFFTVFDRLFGTWRETSPHDRPASYGLPTHVPRTLGGILFDVPRLLLDGVRARTGLPAKLRYVLTRPPGEDETPDPARHPST